jgi:hypothetical protein
MRSIAILYLFLAMELTSMAQRPTTALATTDCLACERITLFARSRQLVDNRIWTGLSSRLLSRPLLYFTDSNTYVAFATPGLFKGYTRDTLVCNNGLSLLKMKRLDTRPFHMENKMNFGDTTSPFYRQPIMLCSDVETMHRFVPDFKRTEDWLQLVMHEYFHSFQFVHPASMAYLADSVRMAADSLDKIYLATNWFGEALQQENAALLSAIGSKAQDSMYWYLARFIETRESRRTRYEKLYKPGLTAMENFWETIEGTARYVEYYMAGYFSQLADKASNRCDSLFHNFADYINQPDFEDNAVSRKRTGIMPAYYYVTGFNLCRVMDKLGIAYREELFHHPRRGLYLMLVERLGSLKK